MNDCNCTDEQVERVLRSNPDLLLKATETIAKKNPWEYKPRLNSKEACDYLNISIDQLHKLCGSENKIQYSKNGKNRYFLVEDLKTYLKDNYNTFLVN